MRKELIQLHVNGRPYELAIEPNALLLDVVRQELQLTGSKRGCDDSSCGACTVLVNGVAMMSCTLLAASCEGQEITTVEGMSEHGALAAPVTIWEELAQATANTDSEKANMQRMAMGANQKRHRDAPHRDTAS